MVSEGGVIIFTSDFFASDDALIGYGQTYSNFNICIPTFLLEEVANVEIIKTRYISNFLRQENEGKIWFVRSCPCLTPKRGG